MAWQYTPYLGVTLAAAGMSAWLCVVAWRRRAIPGALPLAILAAAVCEWALGYALELSARDLHGKLVWDAVQHPGVVAIPVAWLAFALCYVGSESWLTRRRLQALLVFPLLTLLVVAIRGLQWPMYAETGLAVTQGFTMLVARWGPWEWAIWAYCHILIVAGTLLIVRALLVSLRAYRPQLLLILGGVALPWLGNVLFALGLSPFPHLDLTVYAFPFSGLAFLWAITRLHLLDIIPVARHAIIDSMADAVVVLDARDRILDLNPAARALAAADPGSRICRDLAAVFPAWSEVIAEHRGVPQAHTQFTPTGSVRWYDLRIAPLHGPASRLQGRVWIIRDITRRKQAEDAQRRSEDRYRLLFQEAPAGAFEYDRDLRLTAFNERLVAMLQSSRERLADLDLRTLEDPSLIPAFQAALEGKEGLYEGHYRATTGAAELWTHLRTAPVRNSQGDIIGGIGVLADITERVRAEEALARSERLYREAIEAGGGVPYCRNQLDGTYDFIGPQVEDLLGLKPEEMTADALGELIQERVILDASYTGDWLQYRDAYRAGENDRFRANYRVLLADGTERWISDRATAVHDEATGQVVASLGILLDVTERVRAEQAVRESEERYRLLFERSPVGIFNYDPDLRVTDCNGRMLEICRVFGEQIVGLDLGEVPGEMLPALRAPLDGLQGRYEGPCCTGEGCADWISLDTAPILDPAGRIIGAVGIAQDLAERRQLEESQRLAAIGQLAAGVAHEFNNLLASILLKAELARHRGGIAEYESLAELVLHCGRRGAEICQNLTAFARPQRPKRTPLHIEPILEAALAMVTRQVHNAGIAVEREYRARGRCLWGDSGQLEQVFVNLLINATHAMPQGGTLSIGARLDTDHAGDEEIVITVADTGQGIAQGILSRIFEPFFTTKGHVGGGDSPGTGLGLSVSRGIVTAHEGSITVRSELGRGTTFELRFAAFAAEPPATIPPEAQEHAAPPPGLEVLGRVLIAEDEVVIRELLAEMLAADGMEVTVAGSASQAAEALQRAPFDLVVSDLLMPGGGGRAVLAATRALAAPPAVLVITGDLDVATHREVMGLGAAGFLLKPFTTADLREAVRRALDGAQPAADAAEPQAQVAGAPA